MKRLDKYRFKLASDCFSTFLLHIDFWVSPSVPLKDVQLKLLSFRAAILGGASYFSMHRLALDWN